MPQGQGHGEKGGGPLIVGQDMLVALGSNLTSPAGTPPDTLRKALSTMEDHGVVIRAVSSYYHTPAFPAGSGPDFVNAAARICADVSSTGMLEILHAVEAEFGRARVGRWGARTLDIDLIAHGNLVLPNEKTQAAWRALSLKEQLEQTPDELILPHPRLQDRAFVLVPLADVAPDWVHPVLGQSVTQMLAALPDADRLSVRRIDTAG